MLPSGGVDLTLASAITTGPMIYTKIVVSKVLGIMKNMHPNKPNVRSSNGCSWYHGTMVSFGYIVKMTCIVTIDIENNEFMIIHLA